MGLMHIDQLDTLVQIMGLEIHVGLWGHRGQKVIFNKNAISPSDYMVWSWDSSYSSARYPLQKLWVTVNSPGVTWGHGSKGPTTKNAISPSDYMVWSWDSCHIDQLDTSTKVMRSRNSPGVTWGHNRSKGQFSRKNATSDCTYGHGSY